MPGASQFVVPPSSVATDFQWASDQTTQPMRQIPVPVAGLAPAGSNVATCAALESMTPPTLRRAYSIYAVNIAWSALIDATYTGSIIGELALLVNGELAWVGTDAEPTNNVLTDAIASGVISADLVNPIILNPRERLSLRVGMSTSTPIASIILGTMVVGAQYAQDGTGDIVAVQSTISYQILDLPGNRSL